MLIRAVLSGIPPLSTAEMNSIAAVSSGANFPKASTGVATPATAAGSLSSVTSLTSVTSSCGLVTSNFSVVAGAGAETAGAAPLGRAEGSSLGRGGTEGASGAAEIGVTGSAGCSVGAVVAAGLAPRGCPFSLTNCSNPPVRSSAGTSGSCRERSSVARAIRAFSSGVTVVSRKPAALRPFTNSSS